MLTTDGDCGSAESVILIYPSELIVARGQLNRIDSDSESRLTSSGFLDHAMNPLMQPERPQLDTRKLLTRPWLGHGAPDTGFQREFRNV